MKTTADLPQYQPSIGKLITEDCSIGQLCDNRICLLAEEDSPLAQTALQTMQELRGGRADEGWFHSYDMEIMPELELDNHPSVRRQIETEGDNLLIQLTSLLPGPKRFLTVRTDELNAGADIGLMVYSAEKLAKADAALVMKRFALEDTRQFERWGRDALMNSRGFYADYFAQQEESMMHPVFHMAVAPPSASSERYKRLTYQSRMDIFSHVLDYLKKYHKNPQDEKINAELDWFFENIDSATWKHFFLKQSPKLQEKMFCFVNPKMQAEASTLDLKVEYIGSIDKNKKNDGKYRLFMKREYETLMVHFQRKSGFILYLIYLIDRKKNGDKVDTLNLSQHKGLFSRLYEMTYSIDGNKVFEDLMRHYNSDQEMKQKNIYGVLDSIRKDVGAVCERMQEPPEPFLIQDISSHLAVLPQRILLPQEIMQLL